VFKYITKKTFFYNVRYIYGGIISLNEQDISESLKILAAADQLHLQELVDYLQTYLIENKAEWLEQNFELTYRTSFQSSSLLELQQFCTECMTKSPEKVFKSFDFTSLPEKPLISLIKRNDLQMDEVKIWEHVLKWGVAQHPTLVLDPVTWSDDDFKMMETTVKNCLPLIRFFGLTSRDFLRKVRPYRRLLKPQLYEDLLEYHLDPDIDIPNNMSFPRSDELGSEIVNMNIVSLVSAWIDGVDTKNKFAHIKELYLPYEFKLILKGSRDGFTPKQFHTLCDNIPCTVTFIKLKEKEEIIGGYNPITWKDSHEGEWGKTKDSFIFSIKSRNNIRDPIISHVRNADRALFYRFNYGPTFDNDLVICVKEEEGTKDYNCNGCKQHTYEKKLREKEDVYLVLENYEIFQVIKKA
jgi:hypothetical protein